MFFLLPPLPWTPIPAPPKLKLAPEGKEMAGHERETLRDPGGSSCSPRRPGPLLTPAVPQRLLLPSPGEMGPTSWNSHRALPQVTRGERGLYGASGDRRGPGALLGVASGSEAASTFPQCPWALTSSLTFPVDLCTGNLILFILLLKATCAHLDLPNHPLTSLLTATWGSL